MVFAVTHNSKSIIYTDLAVPFPKLSRARNRYILVCSNEYSNSILAKPFKNSFNGLMIAAYDKILNMLIKSGLNS